jgi:hypothetical protein
MRSLDRHGRNRRRTQSDDLTYIELMTELNNGNVTLDELSNIHLWWIINGSEIDLPGDDAETLAKIMSRLCKTADSYT